MLWFLKSGITLDYVIMRIVSILFIVFFILPLHEFAHGYVAYKLGDKTSKYSGRLTLNPFYHIDPIGLLIMFLFGFGWAKPVPVDARNFKNPKVGMALTAVAGPISNILAALVGGVLYYSIAVIFYQSLSVSAFQLIKYFFLSYISINVGLAVFNLLPIPPLDGSRIIGAFLPDKILYKYYQNEQVISLVMLGLLFIGVLSVPIMNLQGLVYKWIMYITKFPFKDAINGMFGV